MVEIRIVRHPAFGVVLEERDEDDEWGNVDYNYFKNNRWVDHTFLKRPEGVEIIRFLTEEEIYQALEKALIGPS